MTLTQLAKRTFAATAVCAGLLLFPVPAAADPHHPTPQAVQQLLAGEQDPIRYDYFRLKQKIGAEEFKKAASEFEQYLNTKSTAVCPDQVDQAVLVGFDTAAAAESHKQWKADRKAAAQAVQQLNEVWRSLGDGTKPSDPELAGVADRIVASKATKSDAVRDLYLRAARDQFYRAYFFRERQSTLKSNLSDAAYDRLFRVIALETCYIDQSNLAWLKQIVTDRGWFSNSRDGKGAAHQAWLLVQHSDRDIAFQEEVLSLMEGLIPQKEASAADYAYLYDRVAKGRNKPQRFGTQGHCTGPGRWEPNTMEEPARVNERRAAIGLEDIESYSKRFVSACH